MIAPHIKVAGFFGADMVARLLAYASTREGRGTPTKVGARSSARSDPAIRISEHLGDLGALRAAIETRILQYAHPWRTNLGVAPFEIAGLEIELVRHGDGAFYGRHIDIGASAQRVISVVYYFHSEPKAYSGGKLRLFAPTGAPIDIETHSDLAVVFPSFVVHEVTKVCCPSGRFMDSRFAINCWLRRPPRVTNC